MEAFDWNSVNDLLPNQSQNTEYQAYDPEFQRKWNSAERLTTVLDDNDMSDPSEQIDYVEWRIVQDALEYVPLSVNLTGVELIEERHHNQSVEYHCEVLCWQ